MQTALDDARDAAQAELAGSPKHLVEFFGGRLEKWFPDLFEALVALYPAAEAAALSTRLVTLASGLL